MNAKIDRLHRKQDTNTRMNALLCFFVILQALYSGFASLKKKVRNVSHAIYKHTGKKKEKT